MSLVLPIILVAAAAQAPAAPAPAAQAPAKPPVPREMPRRIKPDKIILVGDSTTAVIGGWGPSFCAYHVSSFAACLNLARGGRSSRTYMQEGSWDLARREAQVAGYGRVWILIQFGHNDQPGNSRSTELAQEFPGYIRRYVEDAREAGAIPVLVTPLTRRSFVDGKLANDLVPWADAIRKVAAETDTPLLDLNADSAAAVQAMGQQAADRFAQLPRGTQPTAAAPARAATELEVQPTVVPKRAFDLTHLGTEGADYFAAMVARELAAKVPEMRRVLVVEAPAAANR